MSSRGDDLVFYCELCQAPIASNICSTHGIDFVTIKKASEVRRPPSSDENSLAPLQSKPESDRHKPPSRRRPETPQSDPPARRSADAKKYPPAPTPVG